MAELSPDANDNPPRPEPVARTDCHLCALPLGDNPRVLDQNGYKLSFCCRGCLHVFQILTATCAPATDFRRTELFRDCKAAGLIPGDASPLPEPNKESLDPYREPHARQLTFRIDGMWCLSCAWVIEKVLCRTEGVHTARVDFFTDLLEVRYLPQKVTETEIRRRVGRLGYPLLPADTPGAVDNRTELYRLGISAILTANVMMLSLALYTDFGGQLAGTGLRSLAWPLFLLTTPVLFYGGRQILIRGLTGLASLHFSMDTLIATGALTAYLYSLYQLFRQGTHLYFDSAAMLITLVLLGRFIERRVRAGLLRDLGRLRGLTTAKVRVMTKEQASWIMTDNLKSGDRYLVETGETVAADALVFAGTGAVDESILTGEARPVGKIPGDEVLAGSRLLHGRLELAATRLGAAGSVGRTLAMIREGLQSRNRLEELAERVSRAFVPAIFLLAGATAIVMLLRGNPFEAALLRALTVLVVSCPCALGLATPLAKIAIVDRARQKGIVIRNSTAFAKAHQLTALVFDKTGTVTGGNFTLRTLHAPGYSDAEILALASALEAESDHFLGLELLRLARAKGLQAPRIEGRTDHPGLGVSGVVAGETCGIGNRNLMARLKTMIPEKFERTAREAEEEGDTVVFLGIDGEVKGVLIFGDPLRPGISEVVANLRAGGCKIHLLSGDAQAVTARIAARLGITDFAGGRSPKEKVAYIRELHAGGARVAMIGDGLNDSGAMATAELGLAVGDGPSRLLAEGADATLLGDPVRQLPQVMQLSQLLNTTIRTNLAWAFLYNAITIPLALLGYLNPLLAACAMFASSLTVIANTFRLVDRVGETEMSRSESAGTDGELLPTAVLPEN